MKIHLKKKHVFHKIESFTFASTSATTPERTHNHIHRSTLNTGVAPTTAHHVVHVTNTAAPTPFVEKNFY